MNYDKKICIPQVEYKKDNQTICLKIIDARVAKKRRPSKILRDFITIGFERGWWDSSIIKTVWVFGQDKGYWKMNDLIKAYDEKEDEENGTI